MSLGVLLGSFARGYSGFGFSALLVASWSIVTEPAKAVALALVMEVAASILQASSVWWSIPWHRLRYLIGGALIGTPLGVWLLAHIAPETMKLVIALFILASAIALLAGVRLKHRADIAGTAAVGVASGVINGAVAMGGLPVALFLAAEGHTPALIRASMIAYIFVLDLLALLLMSGNGFVGPETITLAFVALPILVLGIWLGAQRFLGATPESFRRVILWILIGLALLGIWRAKL